MNQPFPSWEQFRYLNAANPNAAFEHLCRLLFTAELSLDAPPQQRKNQAGIETEPVEHNGEFVGFQAKHYDNRIDKEDVIASINTAKERHPKLTVLYFYCNLEFGNPQKGHDITRTEGEIKACANKNGLNLVMRMGTQILDLVAKHELAYKHFFDPLQVSKKLLVFEKNQQSEFFLYAQNGLHTSDQQFHLERQELETTIVLAIKNAPLVIIHGESGTGKSALVRTIAEDCHKNTVFCYRRGQYLQSICASTLLCNGQSNWTLEDFDNAHNAKYPNWDKCLVLDSAEHILHSAGLYGILNELTQLICKGWKILFTIRTENLVALQNILRDAQYPQSVLIEVPGISEENVNSILSTFGRKPQYQKDLSFYQNLFYLSLFLKSGGTTSTTDIALNVIKGKYGEALATRRIQAFETYVEQVCKRSSHIVKTRSIEPVGFASLKSDGILLSLDNDTFCTAAHDQFLDWGIERILHEVWEDERNISVFLDKIPEFAKGYNLTSWLKKKIDSDRTVAIKICEKIINTNNGGNYTTDIISALLQSDFFPDFLEKYRNELLKDRARVLLLLSKTINTTCKYKIPDKDSLIPLYHYQGKCWYHLLMFVLNEYQNIDKYALKEIIECLFFFTLLVGNSSIYQRFFRFSWYCFKANPYLSNNILSICEILISYAPNVISDELKINDSDVWANALYKQIMFHTLGYRGIVSSIHEHIFSKFIPKWLTHEVLPEPSNAWYGSNHGLVEPLYGDIKYTPSSAYQTPFYWLLKEHTEEAIPCYLGCIDKIQAYLVDHSPYDTIEEISMYISETECIKIYGSSSLWGAYRGTESPTHGHVLQSMLMALEKYLLEDSHNLNEDFLINLLSKSKSICIAGVISSVVLARPETYKSLALILCRTARFLNYDFDRWFNERHANFLHKNTFDNINEDAFYKERQESDSLEHRQHHLANLALQLQFENSNTAKLLYDSFDDFHKLHENEENFFNDRIFLYNRDKRYLLFETAPYSSNTIKLTPKLDIQKLPTNIRLYYTNYENNKETLEKLRDLKHWCIQNRVSTANSNEASYWDSHPMEALQLVRDIEKRPELYTGNKIPVLRPDEIYATIFLRCRNKIAKPYLIELSENLLNRIQTTKNIIPYPEQSDLLKILPMIVHDIEECRSKALHLLNIKFCELCNQEYNTHEIFDFCNSIHKSDLWVLFQSELQAVWDSAYTMLTEEKLIPIKKLQNLQFLFYFLPNKETSVHASNNFARFFEDINITSTLIINSGWNDFTLHSEFCMSLGEHLISLPSNEIESKINYISPLILDNTHSGTQILHSILFASIDCKKSDCFWKIWNLIYSKLQNINSSNCFDIISAIIFSDRLFFCGLDCSILIDADFYLFFEKVIAEGIISEQRVFEAIAFIFSIHLGKISLHSYSLLSKIIEMRPHMSLYEGTISQLQRMIDNTRIQLSELDNKKLHAHMRELLVLMRDNGSNYAHTKLEQGF